MNILILCALLWLFLFLCLSLAAAWWLKRLVQPRSVATAAALTELVGKAHGELVMLRGYHKDNDGGGGSFYWDADSTTPTDGGMVFGHWHRLWDGVTLYVNWFGARHDGQTDDTAAIVAALNWSGAIYTVQLGVGKYVVTKKIDVPNGKTLQGVMAAHGQGQIDVLSHTTLEWRGPSDSDNTGACVVELFSGSALKKVTITIQAGIAMFSALGINTVGTIGPHIEDCQFVCFAGGWVGRGYFRFGAVLGGNGAQGNCDTVHFVRCYFRDPLRAAVLFSFGQPFGTQFDHCEFWNMLGPIINSYFGYTGTEAAQSHGTVFEYAYGFGSLTVNGGICEFFATILDGFTSALAYVSVNSFECEGPRRLFWFPGYSRSWLPVLFHGGRYNTDEVHGNKTVYGEDGQTVVIEPTDQRLIYDCSGALLNLQGVNVSAGITSEWQEGYRFILPAHGTIIADGCTFPNLHMVERFGSDASHGGTYTRGCRGFGPGQTYGHAPYPDHNGTDHADGYVVIADGATSAYVPMTPPTYEYGRYGQGLPYAPVVQIESFATNWSEGCPLAARKCFAVTTDHSYGQLGSFTINLEAPPGAGEWVTVSYRLTLNRQAHCN